METVRHGTAEKDEDAAGGECEMMKRVAAGEE